MAKKNGKISDRIDHIGVLVKDIDAGVSMYGKMLGLTPWSRGIQENPDTGQKMVILPLLGTFIEVIQPPARVENRWSKWLKERGEGLAWVCFHVDNFDAEVKALRDKGYPVEDQVSRTFPGYQVRTAWVPPKQSGGFWIELADKKSLPDYLVEHKF